MKNLVYGYGRVSSREQNEERQVLALQDFGIRKEQIILDKQSGKDFKRPGYQRLVAKMNPGDTLVVKSIDRLGRNYNEILEQWRILTREKGVAIVVLDMPLLDTRQGKDLTGTLIADIVLQLLSYVAQTERELIHQRQAEGIAAAKARGIKFGRKPMERPKDYPTVREQWEKGTLSARKAAVQLDVTHRTFLKWVKEDIERGYKSTLYFPSKVKP